MIEELPKIIAGIERHISAVRAVQGGLSTSGQSLASAVWELGTMCSLAGKSLKDMSVELERAQPPKPVTAPPPASKAESQDLLLL